jgi:hypothetical protein
VSTSPTRFDDLTADAVLEVCERIPAATSCAAVSTMASLQYSGVLVDLEVDEPLVVTLCTGDAARAPSEECVTVSVAMRWGARIAT